MVGNDQAGQTGTMEGYITMFDIDNTMADSVFYAFKWETREWTKDELQAAYDDVEVALESMRESLETSFMETLDADLIYTSDIMEAWETLGWPLPDYLGEGGYDDGVDVARDAVRAYAWANFDPLAGVEEVLNYLENELELDLDD